MLKYFIFLSLFFNYLFAQNLSKLENWATDLTNILSKEEISFLNKKLKDYQDSTSNQIVVLIMPSLEGNSIEELANEIFKFNKIGTKKNDNGVLLLVAKIEREIRIEVGYGLESRLTDATSSSIIRNIIVPYFKNDKYFEGINLGLDAILQAIQGEYYSDKTEEGTFSFISVIVLFLLLFLFIGIISKNRNSGNFRIRKSGFGYRGPWGDGFGGGFGGFGGGSGFGGGFSGGGGMSGGGGASGRW